MGTEIDRLEVQVEAQARGANRQLTTLINKLDAVSSSLSRINESGLAGLANGVNKFAQAAAHLNSVKTADFTRLAKNIDRISRIDQAALNRTAAALNTIGKSLNSLGGVSASSMQVADMAKNISKLGNKGVQTAIVNIPQLASALKGMMATLSNAPRVSKNLINMTNALANLASKGAKVGSVSSSITSGLSRVGNAAAGAEKRSRSLASTIGRLYAQFWMLQRAFSWIAGGVGKSMDFLETVNYFEVAMKDVGQKAAGNWSRAGYNSAEEYASSFADRAKQLTEKMTGFSIDADGNVKSTGKMSLGIDPDAVMNYQAMFAQMSSSIGMTGESALNASKAFTMLGADWASLRNISFDTAWEKMASALAGQSRAVRSLGIDITQTTLQQYAYKYGLEQSVQEMNQATKAQLRLLAILDQSKVAFGDLANTISSPGNQLRLLQQNFSNLARIIGNLFLPVVQTVLPYINGLVIAIQRLFQWIGGLLGIEFKSENSALGGMSDNIGDLSDGMDDVAGSAGGTADNLDKAEQAAKKLKRTILSFDELHLLNEKDTSNIPSGGNGGSGVGTGGAIGGSGLLDDEIAKALAEYEKAWNEAFSKMENKAQGFADKISNSFKKIWDAAEPTRIAVKKLWDEGLSKLGDFTWTALGDFYREFLVPLGRWTLGKGLPDLINALNNALNKIDWKRLNSSLKNFWQALEPFAEKVGEGLIEFYSDLWSFGASFINRVVPGGLDSLASALRKIDPQTAKNIGYGLGLVATGIAGLKIANSIGSLLGAGSPFAKGMSLLATHPYLSIAFGLAGVVFALDKFGVIDVDWEWLNRKVSEIKDILSDFIRKVDVSGLSDSIGKLWKAFEPFSQGFADAFLEAFDFLLNDIGAPLLNGLVGILNGIADAVSKFSPEDIEKAGEAIGKFAIAITTIKVSTGIIEKLSQLKESISGIGTVLGTGGTGTEGNANPESSGSGTGGWLKGLVTFLAGSKFAQSLGATAAFQKTLEHTMKIDTENAYSGLINALVILSDQGEITSKDLDDFYQTLFTAQIKGQPFEEEAEKIKIKLSEMGVSSEKFSLAFLQAMDKLGVPASQQKEIIQSLGLTLDGVSSSVDSLGSSAQSSGSTLSEALFSMTQSGKLTAIQFAQVCEIIDKASLAGSEAGISVGDLALKISDLGLSAETVDEIMGLLADTTDGLGTNIETSSQIVYDAAGTYKTYTGTIKKAEEQSDSAKESFGKLEKTVTGLPEKKEMKITADTSDAMNKVGDMDTKVSGVADNVGSMKATVDTSEAEASLDNISLIKLAALRLLMTGMKFTVKTDEAELAIEELEGSINNILKEKEIRFIADISSFDRIGERLYRIGENAASSFARGIRSIHVPTPHVQFSSYNTYYMGSATYKTPNFTVNWYKNGGFPDGEIWGMNESGNPEMIGKVGGKNAVANNAVIAEAIRSAVVDGFMEAFMTTSGGKQEESPTFYIEVKTEDNEVLARAVKKGQKKMDRRMKP